MFIGILSPGRAVTVSKLDFDMISLPQKGHQSPHKAPNLRRHKLKIIPLELSHRMMIFMICSHLDGLRWVNYGSYYVKKIRLITSCNYSLHYNTTTTQILHGLHKLYIYNLYMYIHTSMGYNELQLNVWLINYILTDHNPVALWHFMVC